MAGVAVRAGARPSTDERARLWPEPPEPPERVARRPPPVRPTLGYRPALDGLRAVAVLAVMVEHAGLRRPGSTEPLLPGGFLGVDVFFVVSGFLITSLLLVEHASTGRVDLRAFWLRRARRLLPAAGVAVAGTCLVAAVAGLDLDGSSLRGDALAALGYVANWRFVVTEQSYFAAFGLPSPFRHLWSLSLEEQWYLVFPPMLVGLLALVRRRTGVLLAVLGAAAVASAAWMAACWTPGSDPSRVYYGTDTRAQALLVGAVLAVVTVRLPAFGRRLARHAPVLGVVGCAALVTLFATISGRNPALFRGGFLIVAVASVAVVAGVALPGASGPVHRVLGWRPFVGVGLLSYGLYLWHWPVFVVMTPDRVGLAGAGLAAARVAVAFLVATVSYAVVERPIRRHGLRGAAARLWSSGGPADVRGRGRVVGPVAAALAASVVVALVVASTRTMAEDDTTAEWTPVTTPVTASPVTTTSLPPSYLLPAVPPDRPLRVMVGGDSVAWSLAFPWTVDDEPMPAGIDVRLVAALGCTVTPGSPVVDGVERPPTMCPDWPATWEATAYEFQPDVVVVMWGAWEVYYHRLDGRTLVSGTAEFGELLERSLADSIERVAGVAPNARLVFVTVPCMDERELSLGGAASPRNDPARVAWVNKHVARVVAAYAGRTTTVDLGPLVCRGTEAVDDVDGLVPREDGVHLTPAFGAVAWRYIDERVRPWLAVPVPVAAI